MKKKAYLHSFEIDCSDPEFAYQAIATDNPQGYGNLVKIRLGFEVTLSKECVQRICDRWNILYEDEEYVYEVGRFVPLSTAI